MTLLLSTPDRPDNRAMSPAACNHVPACPEADADDRDAAHVLFAHPEQGWSLLCNGVILFDDFGDIRPDCRCTGSPRAAMRDACVHRVLLPHAV